MINLFALSLYLQSLSLEIFQEARKCDSEPYCEIESGKDGKAAEKTQKATRNRIEPRLELLIHMQPPNHATLWVYPSPGSFYKWPARRKVLIRASISAWPGPIFFVKVSFHVDFTTMGIPLSLT